MNKARLYYIIAAIVIGFSMLMLWGVSGESGIVIYYLTVALTFPVGLLVGYICSLLSEHFNPNVVGLFFLPLAAIANYFQWTLFISLFKKWKQKKNKNHSFPKLGNKWVVLLP